MNTTGAKTMAAAGFVAGALLNSVTDVSDVIAVTTASGTYTGEVRYRFLGTWYTITPAAAAP